MANEDNLKMFGSGARSESEERKLQSKGGQNSGAARRRKKNMKQSAKALMDTPVSKSLAQKMKTMGIDEDDATYQMGIMVAMLQEALGGNVKAAQFIREMIGEDPKQEMQRKEFKLKSDEFKYKKEQDERAAAAQQESSSLADDILAAWVSRENGTGGEDDEE